MASPKYLIIGAWLLLSGFPAAAQIATQSMPLSDVTVTAKYQAQAEVVALNRSQLTVEVTGIVDEIAVEVADKVKAGDLLVRLDDSDLQLELRQAQAQLASADARVQQAKARLERAQRLRHSEFISADDLLDRETDLKIQEADRDRLEVATRLAKRRLDYTRIEAPYDATVIARSAQVGQRVSPGQLILTLVDVAPPMVMANIPAADLPSLERATGFALNTQSGNFDLQLDAIAGAIDPETRIIPARFAFPAQSALPGATGTVNWTSNGTLIPVHLIVRRNGELGIFVVADDCPKFVPLPEAEEGRPSRHHLSGDTAVITSGHKRLTDCHQSP
ncbi:MAG: efflux RND transporter periplasmic adaptor subunit [Lysobacterales bacterium]